MSHSNSAEGRCLDYVEFHVVDRCNLNCCGCSHYAPMVKRDFDHFPSFKEDLTKLRQLFARINRIRLLGGEPFLDNELDKFVVLARELFPISRIEVVTNGLLVPKAAQAVLNSLAKNRIVVNVSVYPPTLKLLGEIINILERKEIQYVLSEPITRFYKMLSPAGKNNPSKAFDECAVNKRCTFVYMGKLYLCGRMALVNYFNECAGTEIGCEDCCLDLKRTNPEEVAEFLSKPNDSCRYCGKAQRVPWNTCSNLDEIDIGHWVVSDTV